MDQSQKALKPTQKTYNLLYARSGNRCAFPGCTTPITDGSTLVGEVAHICGEAPNSARHDETQTSEERRSYDNLILLCLIHHKVVDDDWKSYSRDRLREMKAEHEESATCLNEAEIKEGLEILIAGDLRIGSIGSFNNVVGTFYQQNVHNYGSNNSIPVPNDDYIPISPRIGQSRFRGPDEKLGTSQPLDPLGQGSTADIFMAAGPTLFLRLMPTKKQQRTYTFAELQRAASGGGNYQIPLRPTPDSFGNWMDAFDGIGRYEHFGDDADAKSLSFLFKSGEIWHTSLLSAFGRESALPYTFLQQGLPRQLDGFASILDGLGIPRPFRWILGVEGVRGARLMFQAPPGKMYLSTPSLKANDVIEEASFATGDNAEVVLDRFFTKLFEECGISRPDHLSPKI